jgi:hypothetical protein
MRGAEYEPTDAQRALVENAVAFGLTQADIAEQLRIDEKTLRKHFRVELSSGKFKVDMTAGNVCHLCVSHALPLGVLHNAKSIRRDN